MLIHIFPDIKINYVISTDQSIHTQSSSTVFYSSTVLSGLFPEELSTSHSRGRYAYYKTWELWAVALRTECLRALVHKQLTYSGMSMLVSQTDNGALVQMTCVCVCVLLLWNEHVS